MLVVALDTSTRYSSVALCTEEGVLSEYSWFSGTNHSTEALGYIQRASAEQHVALEELDAVAVATGPGTFNGLRVALSAAKTLAFALRKPLIGISTLDVVAGQHVLWSEPFCAVLEAGRSELYAAWYISESKRDDRGVLTAQMRRLSEYLLCTPQQLLDFMQEHAQDWSNLSQSVGARPYLFCGEISAPSRQSLDALMPGQCLFLQGLLSVRRATTLAALALQRIQAQQIDDPLVLEPLYVRRPSITKSTRKRPLLDGASQRSTGQDTTEREEGALRH